MAYIGGRLGGAYQMNGGNKLPDSVIQKLKNRREYILPLLLTFFLNASIFGIYGEAIYSKYNLLSAAVIVVMFIYFEFMNRHRIIGGCIYFIAGMFCLSTMFRFIFSSGWNTGFFSWFLSAGEEAPERPEYFYALVSSFPFFLSSVVYYFSVILYRPSFLMLGSLVPCAIYVKTVTGMSTFYLVCIAGLNAALYAVNAEKLSDGGIRKTKSGGNARFLSSVIVTCITLFIASLIPKQGEAVYYEVFERNFMIGEGNGEGFSRELSERSGNAGEFRDLDSTPLFNVYADDLLYLRRQNFDIYSPEEHCWYPLEQYSQTYFENPNETLGEREFLNLDDMLAAMKKGAELDSELRNKTPEKLLALENTSEKAAVLTVEPIDFAASYKISSIRSYSITPQENIAATPHKELAALSGNSNSYSFSYYSEQVPKLIWTGNGGSDFSSDKEYSDYLDRLISVLSKNNENRLLRTAEAFRNDFDYSLGYREAYGYNLSDIPEDIKRLAEELTAGLDYDYEKASALEKFFQDNFTYDLDYYPPDGSNTASYFVFESRRGTCSDFATAFTLMARAVGLTVRYTEGFSPDITTNEGVYIIRVMSSHAYPEVYIRNLGWTVYEPTVSGAYSISGGMGRTNTGTGISIDMDILMTVIFTLLGIAVITVIVYFLIPAARLIHDEIKIRRGGTDSVILIYRRMSEKVGIKSRKYKGLTANMTPTEISEKIKELFDYSADEFIKIYHDTVFGEISPDEKTSVRASEIYADFKKAVKTKKKKDK